MKKQLLIFLEYSLASSQKYQVLIKIQKFQIMKGCVIVFLLAIFLISSVHTEDSIQLVNIGKEIIDPQMIYASFPGRTIEILPFENVTTKIQQINYELDYKIYARKGALGGIEAFKLQNYEQSINYCRLYKTDLKLNIYKQKQLEEVSIDHLIVNYQTVQNGTIAKIFTVSENNTVNVYKISINQEFSSLKVSQINWAITSTMIDDVITFKLDTTNKITFLEIEKAVYFISNTSMILYRDPLPNEQRVPLKQIVEGYVPTGEIISVGFMKDKIHDRSKKFYVLTQNSLDIYSIQSDLKVYQLASITDLKDQNKLEDCIYDNSLFYIVGVNSLYIVQVDGIKLIKISKANLNGTCTFIEKFLTTLHITCSYQKVNYVLELFAIGNNLRLNRYYVDEDIRGRAISRRLGLGKMAIMTDKNIKFLNYGINRKILLERQTAQPQFLFNFNYGLQMLPIAAMSNLKYSSLLLFTAEKMMIIQLLQIPPQLYCQFPQQGPGVQYQILMRFNSSRCFYINNEDDQLYGSMETMCQTSYPVLIKSKKLQLEQKNTDFITLILLILILGIGLLVLACFIKYHRSLDSRFNRMQKKLELVKMGFKKEKKAEAGNEI